jgi:cytoskeletal protein RodZ
MAPEQWASGTVDLRADIYSLGIMLFEMLSGALPFEGDTPFRLMHMHMYEAPKALRELKPNSSPDIDYIIARALAKQPDDRFQSAGEMAKALRKAVTGVTSSFVAERPSSPAPVSTRNLSAPADKITLLPFDGEVIGETGNGSGSNIILDRVTLLPVDAAEAPRESIKQSMKVTPAPFEDTDYPAPRQHVIAPEQRAINSSKKAAEKAALKARKQQNMNLVLMATAGIGMVVIGIFVVMLIRGSNGQSGLPTTAPLNVAALNNTTSTSVPLDTEAPLATFTPRHTATITYTPSNTATRRPTWTREPTDTPRPASTRRPTNQPAANTSSLGSGTTTVVGTIRTETDIRAGVGETHPVLFKARVGDQFPVEGKMMENGQEWFQITLQGGAPAWIIASAIAVTPGSYIPVVTPRPKPPKQ